MAGAERAVVLGADLEGLVAAAFLARAGKSVVVVDPRTEAGGAAARLPVGDAHAAPGLFHDPALTRRALLQPLDLESHGLAWRAEPDTTVRGTDGTTLTITRDPDGVQGLEGPDAAAFGTWRGFLGRLAPLVTRVIDEPPPDAVDPSPGELFRLARTGLTLRTLGERDMLEVMRVAPLCAWDWLAENFEHALLRAGLAGPALRGTVYGPRAAGTGAFVMLAECLRGSEPVGGASAVVEALLASCRSRGVEFRHRVARGIAVDEDGVSGVEIDDGETIETRRVVSALSPARTLLELLPGGLLPAQMEDEAKGWRARGADAALLLALPQRPADLATRCIVADGPDDLERNADHLKYGELPERPWLDLRAWDDPGLAPAGGATLSILVHGVSHGLRSGWDEKARKTLEERIVASLERVAPGLAAGAVARELLTPADLEERLGLAGGHLYGGEFALDQLWIQRPALPLCRYATPVRGLTLCGAASHPGGPFLGGAGALGARAALGD